ncbi:MAG: T9SS type A sorting domain-containing protein [Armatimonadetes bacterium]|nr:T9SS type A sorting domain-containing protein [Armatimonadota bacterium]
MKKLMMVLCLVIVLNLSSTIINIPAEYSTIQEGINIAVAGDTVLVHPGTYVENINYNGKDVIVASLFLTTQDTTYISSTIIDGNQNGTVVIFENGESTDAILCGFTLMNGMKTIASSGGGGVYIHNSNPHLHNLIISSNFATSGGGICIHDASPIISNMIIVDNEVPVGSGHGGGLYLMNCDNMIIKNLSIIHNETGAFGSGLFISGCESLIFENLIVSNNECGYFGGGALYFQNSDAIILNSTICYNNNQYSGGGLIGGENVYLVNSVVYGNSGPQLEIDHSAYYSLIQGGFPGIGNIDSDPLFTNPSECDFHLQDSSPCIGSGIDEIEIDGIMYFAPEFDFGGNPRPAPTGSMPDMGVYENLLGVPQVGVYNNQLPSNNFNLSNYPNPFNPTTTISFSIPEDSNIELSIYNIKGQKVKQLFSDQLAAGQHSVVWDGRDENNQPVGSGIYLYQLNINGNSKAVNKMILIK